MCVSEAGRRRSLNLHRSRLVQKGGNYRRPRATDMRHLALMDFLLEHYENIPPELLNPQVAIAKRDTMQRVWQFLVQLGYTPYLALTGEFTVNQNSDRGCRRTVLELVTGGLGLISVGMTFLSLPALAQIVPDATLGSEGSQVTPNVNVGGNLGDRIDGGAVRGSSLFHSFSQFNINNGQRVYFADPAGIANIFSRVTGSNISNILGTLGVEGAANLFLLNPNGIFFGPNAVVDIQGSFVATTGDRFVFPGGAEFGASNPQAPPLLTMSVPVGVQYGAQPGNITNTGNLTVGQDLMLAGGNLDLQGELRAGRDLTLQAQNTVRARDSVTNRFIAAAGEELVVQGNQAVDIVALNHPNSGLFSGGDMVLRSANTVGGDAHYWSGGNFRIETLDGNLGNLFSPADPVIRASGDVSFANYEGASLHIFAGGSVTIGDVRITGADTVGNAIAENVTLSDGTTIVPIDGTTQPTLDIRAGTTAINPPSITGNTTGFSSGVPGISGTGTSADISINSITINDNIPNNGGILFLTNQYQPNSLVSPNGITIGSIDIRDGGSIAVDSRSGITFNRRVDTFPTNYSNGTVTLLAGSDITVNNTVDTSIKESGGDIKLFATGNITLNGNLDASVQTVSADGLEPVGGDITVQSGGNITINSNGFIDTSAINFDFDSNTNAAPTFDTNQLIGRAGNVLLEAGGNITLTDTGILAAGVTGGFVQLKSGTDTDINDTFIDATTQSNNGDSGFINITGRSLSITTSSLDVENFGSGDAGDIVLNASDRIAINNSTLSSNGNFGRILIGTNSDQSHTPSTLPQIVEIGNSKLVTTNSRNDGSVVGDIFIDASDRIAIENSTISGDGNLGRIVLGYNSENDTSKPQSVEISNSNLNSRNFPGSTANAGDINIQADSLQINNSNLSTSTFAQGNAGNFSIDVSGAVSLNDSRIFSTVEGGGIGDGGLVTIKAGSLSLINEAQVQTLVRGTTDTQGNSLLAQGDAGEVFINVSGHVSLDDSSIFSSVEPGGIGNGGLVEIEAGSLALTNNASVQTQVGRATNNQIAQGNAGNVSINVSGDVSLDDSSIFSSVQPGGQGNAGSVELQANSLSLTNGASLDVNNKVQGDAGNITINANRVTLNNQSVISAETVGGQGGNINITATELVLRYASNISTSAGTETTPGNGGKITINAEGGFVRAVPSENSNIVTNAFGGQGGEITISTNRVLGLKPENRVTTRAALDNIITNNPSQISAGSDIGTQGTIEINSLTADPSQGLVELPIDVVDRTNLIATGCGSTDGKTANRQGEFVVTGRGGLPPSPDDLQTSGTTSPDWVTRDMGNVSGADIPDELPATDSTDTLVEAQGMVKTALGELILTAQSPTTTPHQSGLSTQFCSPASDRR